MTIENGNVKLKRGESCAIQVCVKINGEPYTMKRADRIRMVVKRAMLETEPEIIDRTSVGANIIRIRSEDTSRLSLGKYRYSVQLIESSGEKHTVVDPHYFEIAGG